VGGLSCRIIYKRFLHANGKRSIQWMNASSKWGDAFKYVKHQVDFCSVVGGYLTLNRAFDHGVVHYSKENTNVG